MFRIFYRDRHQRSKITSNSKLSTQYVKSLNDNYGTLNISTDIVIENYSCSVEVELTGFSSDGTPNLDCVFMSADCLSGNDDLDDAFDENDPDFDMIDWFEDNFGISITEKVWNQVVNNVNPTRIV
jgi:hypothetical protein